MISYERLIGADLDRFLWVKLQLQRLCELHTEYQVREKLGQLSGGMKSVYSEIFYKIENNHSFKEAKTAIGWLLCAKAPLRSRTWAAAVSWALGSESSRIVSDPMRISAEALLAMCHNLVVYDEQQDIVAFAHLSVREFLESKAEFLTLELERMASECCLFFLIQNRNAVSDLDVTFRRYATRHCFSHVQACQERPPTLLDTLFGSSSDPNTAFREWRHSVEFFACRERDYRFADEIATLMSPLLAAVHFGLYGSNILRSGSFDPNSTDEYGLSLLSIASKNGHTKVAQKLLEDGAVVNPQPVESDSWTAIVYDSSQSNTFLNLNGTHPLFLAIKHGHSEVMTLLLDAGAKFQGESVGECAAKYRYPSLTEGYGVVAPYTPRLGLGAGSESMEAIEARPGVGAGCGGGG